jgi:hypothetical protein
MAVNNTYLNERLRKVIRDFDMCTKGNMRVNNEMMEMLGYAISVLSSQETAGNIADYMMNNGVGRSLSDIHGALDNIDYHFDNAKEMLREFALKEKDTFEEKRLFDGRQICYVVSKYVKLLEKEKLKKAK